MSAASITWAADLAELLAGFGLDGAQKNGSGVGTFKSEKYAVWSNADVSFEVPVLGCTCFRQPGVDEEIAARGVLTTARD